MAQTDFELTTIEIETILLGGVAGTRLGIDAICPD